MRSMRFILVTLCALVWNIGCAGMSPQLELTKSEILYSKPLTSNHSIKGEKIEYELWFDNDIWTVLNKEGPLYKTYEEETKKRKIFLTHALIHRYNQIVVLIGEHRDPVTLEEIAQYALQAIRSEKGAQIVTKELRVVNGNEVLYIKLVVTKNSIEVTSLYYYCSNNTGTITLYVGSKDFLNDKIESEMIDLLNGLVVSKEESNAKPHYNQGLAYLRKSQYDEAIIELNKAIEIYPRYALAYNDRGVAYLRKKQYDRAISDFTKALDINPRHHHAHYNRGIAYLDKRNYDEAISDLNNAIELDPTNPEIYYERGFAYLLKQQNDKAIADFNQAITLNPRYAEAFNDRGWAYVRKRKYDQAISNFTKAIEIEPKYNKAYNNRAVAYFYKKDYDKAWEDVYKTQSLGLQVHPKFLEDLRSASGREK